MLGFEITQPSITVLLVVQGVTPEDQAHAIPWTRDYSAVQLQHSKAFPETLTDGFEGFAYPKSLFLQLMSVSWQKQKLKLF